MHVQEKFEIANDTGLFDGGFHRRLWIKRVSPQRVKAGSFQPVGAKVDRDRALFNTSEGGGVFDIRIATEAGTLSRGNHVIELGYTAKYQFAIYKNFEDCRHAAVCNATATRTHFHPSLWSPEGTMIYS